VTFPAETVIPDGGVATRTLPSFLVTLGASVSWVAVASAAVIAWPVAVSLVKVRDASGDRSEIWLLLRSTFASWLPTEASGVTSLSWLLVAVRFLRLALPASGARLRRAV